jgi:hypothetical protein
MPYFFVFLIFFLFFPLKTFGQINWFDDDFSKRIPIIIKKSIPSLSDYPVYLDLSLLADSLFFEDIKENGGDIIITDSNNNRLPVELVNIATSSKTGEMYFLAENIMSSSSFYIYYGNSQAEQPEKNEEYGAGHVWDENYKLVYHLNGSSYLEILDSTLNSYNSAGKSGTITFNSTGKIWKATEYTGLGYIYSSYGGVSGDSPRSISFWIKTNKEEDRDIFCYGELTRFNLRIDELFAGAGWGIRAELDTGDIRWTADIADDNWHYITLSYNGGGSNDISFYADGEIKEIETGGDDTPLNSNGSKNILLGDGIVKPPFYGIIDEFRFSDSDRSESWAQTEYYNMSDPVSFFMIGEEESRPEELGDNILIPEDYLLYFIFFAILVINLWIVFNVL